MSPKTLALATIAVPCLFIAMPSSALVLYDNGPDTMLNAYTIGGGLSVTDSFAMSAPSILNGITFSNWLYAGASASSVDWAITTLPFGGTTLAKGTAVLRDSPQFMGTVLNKTYSVYQESFSVNNVSLNAGAYWLQLKNEVVAGGRFPWGFWGVSGGQSHGKWSAKSIPIKSESFQIAGVPAVPEPETYALMMAGLGLLGFVARRSKMQTA